MARLVLASRSTSRAALLAGAGLAFDTLPSTVDERSIDEPLLAEGREPAEIALRLAEAKALDVARRRPDDLVLGADQTLGLDGELFVKPDSIDEARRHLLRLRGRPHQLHSALVLARGNETIWHHVSHATLTMRAFTDVFLERYLSTIGQEITKTVGCYRLEGPGIRLFDEIEGDYFTILGLPLLPLLAQLRDMGIIDG
jgi:septum formation protein